MKEKVIIIGSGLGGLSSGLILAKMGYEVTILEQSNQPGGCLQCFYRGGVKFETGMHFIGSCDEGQILNRLMKILGIDDVKLSALDPDGYDVISLNGKRYKIAKGKEGFIASLLRYFPDSEADLRRYYELIELVSRASSLHNLDESQNDAAICTEFQLRSINDVIDEAISDPILRKVVVGNLPLYAGEYDKTPFSTHAFITDFYNQSAYRIVGGSDNITKALVRNLKRCGAEVLTCKKVEKIVCDDTKAVGVETADGQFFEADYVISAVHPSVTMSMIDSKLIRPVFRRRLMNVPNTVSGFSVYLKFKKEKLPYMNYNFYGYNYDTPWDCEKYTDSTWPKGYLYMHFCHEGGENNQLPKYAESGVILSYMNMKDVERWKDTTIGRRGEDYKKFKEEKARKLIDCVVKEYPELADAIEDFYTSSPLTYRDYTATVDGSIYGIAKDINAVNECRVPHRTRIPNLLLTGQNINSHGMLGVLVGTLVTCSALVPNIINLLSAEDEG